MNINLTEPELKQAITEYLSKRLVQQIVKTDITLTAGRAPNGMTASVDIDFNHEELIIIDLQNIETADQPVITKVEKIAPEKAAPKKVTKPAVKEEKAPAVVEPTEKEVFEEVKEELGLGNPAPAETVNELDAFGAPTEPTVEEPVVAAEVVEAPIVEGENTMTENFELKTSADNVAAPIVDDVEDLFNC